MTVAMPPPALQPVTLAVLAIIKFYFLPVEGSEDDGREPNTALFELLLERIYDVRR
jgi:hypothetical protein